MDVDVEGAVLCSGYLISKHISRGRCSLGGDLHSTGVWAGLGMETGAETRSRGGWRTHRHHLPWLQGQDLVSEVILEEGSFLVSVRLYRIFWINFHVDSFPKCKYVLSSSVLWRLCR